MINHFGPESKNPRERRAFAHTAIANAKKTGTAEDFTFAEYAVNSAGDSMKSKASGFTRGLFAVLMSDDATRIILETAYDIDATANEPLDRVALEAIGKSHDRIGRVSVDYSTGVKGVWMGRLGISDQATGEVDTHTNMWVTDFDTSTRIDVPGTEDGNLDPRTIRLMPDDARQELASIVSRVA